ncbi:WXG100 family type VII secretion target [Isobaculum melis]|uniref:ESAT-6-like protein n=1 Tax=Isobaculum melis TaxID=142588 RepID=A0A1H9QDA6_9LACT|nr:WXG100 family type VII secretion target [Isobaculum melis]SER58398.1 WXG100 family type VII secretion target [Isobaculum melis]
MGRIKLTPDELENSAKKYAEGAGEVRNVLQNLKAEQGIIHDNWEGNAFTKFEEQFDDLSKKVEQFADLLDQIKQQMDSVADIVRNTDAEIASKIGGL